MSRFVRMFFAPPVEAVPLVLASSAVVASATAALTVAVLKLGETDRARENEIASHDGMPIGDKDA
jgi:hypothetical protein